MENMKIDRKCKFRKKSLKVQRTADTIKKKIKDLVRENLLVLLLKPTNIHFPHFPSATELQAESSHRQNTARRDILKYTHTHTHEHTDTPHTHAKY